MILTVHLGVQVVGRLLQTTYEFEIVNNTPYHLDSVQVNIALDRNFSLAPNEISERFTFNDRPNLASFFAQGSFALFVEKYSAADSTFRNGRGSAFPSSYLLEDEVNRIVISTNRLPRNDPYGHFTTSIESGRYE